MQLNTLTYERKAFAKVNLSLRVRGRRESDGYHLLDMVNVTTDFGDDVSLKVSPARGDNSIKMSGEFAEGLPLDNSNLALRAAELFSEVTGNEFSVEISIEKNIPSGSGLGGGSSDAAAVLSMLQDHFYSGVDYQLSLLEAALALGADIPYLLYEKPAFVSGIGETIEPIVVDDEVSVKENEFSGKDIVLVRPKSISINTAELFKDVRAAAYSNNEPGFGNDLEQFALKSEPKLEGFSEELRRCAPNSVVRMTGSGSCFFVMNGSSQRIERADLRRVLEFVEGSPDIWTSGITKIR